LVARRNQVVRHRARINNEVHAILHEHLISPCPHAHLFGRLGRSWLGRQELPDDERAAIDRIAELDRLAMDPELLDCEIAEDVIEDPSVKRLLTITGVNVIVAAGLVAAIGDIRHFSSPQKPVSYVGLNPRVRQSGLGWPSMAASASAVVATRAPYWSRRPGLPAASFFLRIRADVVSSRRGSKLAVLCWQLLTKNADTMGASRAGRSQDTRDAATGWTAGEKGQQAWRGLCLRIKGIDVARHAEH
jgi:transposase